MSAERAWNALDHTRVPRRSGRSALAPAGLPGRRWLAMIPVSHRDLVECPPVAALSTISADGYPQTSVVWCDWDGEYIRVNTMRGFAKERNMRRDPRVTLLCFDPQRPLRYLEVRGTVISMTERGAGAHLDAIAAKYACRTVRYFGDVVPTRFSETEIAVLCLISPTHVVALDSD
jgi:PPOX class probable F420-dependent enzyme